MKKKYFLFLFTLLSTLCYSQCPATATAGGSETICSNGTATVSGASASANGIISWTEDGAGSITSGATTLTPVYTAAAGDAGNTVILTMTVTNNTCTPASATTATATFSVIVNDIPTASAGGSVTICSNGTATVSGATSSNGTISWTENGAGSLTSGGNTLTPVYTAAAGDAGNTVTLTMTVTDATCNPDLTATATFSVVVKAIPTASAGGSATICSNGTATVSGATSSNGTISWTENGAGSLTSGGNTLIPVYTAAAGDAGNTVTLTMTVTDATCNPDLTATATFSVIVRALPTATAGGSTTICSNGTATVSGATATVNGASAPNGTISWTENGAGSITSGGTTLTPVYTASASDAGNTVTLTMTVTDATCNPVLTATATFSVIVRALPTATAGGSTTICSNGTATVSGATATVNGASAPNGTISWTENGAGSITSGGTTLTPVYTASAGDAGNTVTLTMTVTDATCNPDLTSTSNFTINVVALPTANAGGATPAICQGGTTAALGGSVSGSTTGGTWSTTSGGTFNPNATTLNATWTPPASFSGPATLILTTSGGSCGTDTDSKQIVVNATTSANAGNTATICSNQQVTVSGASASFGGSIQWTENGAGSITSGSTTLTPTYTAAPGDAGNTVTLTMTVTSSTCVPSTASDQTTIAVSAGPFASAGGAVVPICQGGTTLVLGGSVGGGATGGTWSSSTTPPGTFAPNATTLNATWTPPAGFSGFATLTLTTSGGSCGTDTDDKNVEVRATPLANAGADDVTCQGVATTSLGGSVSGSASGGTWSSSTTPPGTFAPNATNLNATWTPPASFSGQAILTLTTSGGTCGTDTDTKLINVTTAPLANAGADAAICQGGTTLALGGSVSGAATGGAWTSSTNPQGTFTPNATALNATWTPPADFFGPATLTLTTSGGSCGTNPDTKQIVVNATPLANAGQAITDICQGGTTTGLGGSISGAATGGTWSTPSGGTFNPNANTLNATWTPPTNFSGTAILRLTTTGGACGTDFDEKSVTVRPTISLSSPTITTTTCDGTPATINLNGLVPGSSYFLTYTINSIATQRTVGGTSPTFQTGNLNFNQNNGQPLVITNIEYASGTACADDFPVNGVCSLSVRQNPALASFSVESGICQGSSSTITLNGLRPGQQIIQYTINGGSTQTDTINPTGSFPITLSIESAPIAANNSQIDIISLTFLSQPQCSIDPNLSPQTITGLITAPTISSISQAFICQGISTATFNIDGNNLNANNNNVTCTINWAGSIFPTQNSTFGPVSLQLPQQLSSGTLVIQTGILPNASPQTYAASSIVITAGSGCTNTYTPTQLSILNNLLVIKPNPVFNNPTSGQITLCPGDLINPIPIDVTVLGNPNPTFDLNWILTPANEIGFGTSGTNNNITGISLPANPTEAFPINSITNITLTAIVNQCSTTVSNYRTFNIKEQVSFGLLNSNQSICDGSLTNPICVQSGFSPSTTSFTYFGGSNGFDEEGNLNNNCVSSTPLETGTATSNQNVVISVVGFANGCRDTVSATITAKPLPRVTNEPFPPVTLCSQENFLFNGLTYNLSTPITGTWNFRDGNNNPLTSNNPINSSNSLSFNFNNSISESITGTLCVVLSSQGCIGPEVCIATITVLPSPQILTINSNTLNNLPIPLQTKCSNSILSANFSSVPNITNILVEQTAGEQIGSENDTTIFHDGIFSFVSSTPSNNQSAPAQFTSTPSLTCPVSGITQTGQPVTFSFNVNPGATISAERSLPNGNIIPFPGDTLYVCSGSPLPQFKFQKSANDANLNWKIKYNFSDVELVLPDSTTDIVVNSAEITVPSQTPINNGDVNVTLSLTIEATSVDTSLPCSNDIVKTIIVRPRIKVVQVSDTTVCHGTQVSIPLQIDPPIQGFKFTWTNNNTAIGLPAASNPIQVNNSIGFTANNTFPETQTLEGIVSIGANIPLFSDSISGVLRCASLPADGDNIKFTVYSNPIIDTLSDNNQISGICSGSKFIELSIKPRPISSFTYEHDWVYLPLNTNLPSNGLNAFPSFPDDGTTKIGITTINTTSNCRSPRLEIEVPVSAESIADLSNSCIVPTPEFDGLFCSNTETQSFKWGSIRCTDFDFNSSFSNNTFQTFFPENFSSSLSTIGYWVELKRNNCRTRIFYQDGCMLNFLKDDINFNCPVDLNELGINDYNTSSSIIEVSPNPTNGYIRLSTTSKIQMEYTIRIIDFSGKIVFNKSKNMLGADIPVSLDISALSNGIYTIVLNNNVGEQIINRIVKQ